MDLRAHAHVSAVVIHTMWVYLSVWEGRGLLWIVLDCDGWEGMLGGKVWGKGFARFGGHGWTGRIEGRRVIWMEKGSGKVIWLGTCTAPTLAASH